MGVHVYLFGSSLVISPKHRSDTLTTEPQVSGLNSILDTFNAAIHQKVIVFIDEGGDFKAHHTNQEKFKSIITSNSFQLRQMYHDQVQLTSYHNFIMATNSDSAVALDSEARRFFYKRCRKPDWPDSKWNTLHNMIKDPEVVRWAVFLLHSHNYAQHS